MIVCEHCGIKVWFRDMEDHLAIDHGIASPLWGTPCPDCEGSGDAPRKVYEAAPGICKRCRGRGML